MMQSFSRYFVIADYMVNIDAYKKSCINKARPKLHCNGKCQALKKLNSKEKEESSKSPRDSKYIEVESVLSSKSFFPNLSYLATSTGQKFYAYNFALASNFINSIFHPPGLSF